MDRLVAVTSERDQLLTQFRDMGAKEGDRSLIHQLCVWRYQAGLSGQRQALAERALRALSKHWPEATTEIHAWQDATNQKRSTR